MTARFEAHTMTDNITPLPTVEEEEYDFDQVVLTSDVLAVVPPAASGDAAAAPRHGGDDALDEDLESVSAFEEEEEPGEEIEEEDDRPTEIQHVWSGDMWLDLLSKVEHHALAAVETGVYRGHNGFIDYLMQQAQLEHGHVDMDDVLRCEHVLRLADEITDAIARLLNALTQPLWAVVEVVSFPSLWTRLRTRRIDAENQRNYPWMSTLQGIVLSEFRYCARAFITVAWVKYLAGCIERQELPRVQAYAFMVEMYRYVYDCNWNNRYCNVGAHAWRRLYVRLQRGFEGGAQQVSMHARTRRELMLAAYKVYIECMPLIMSSRHSVTIEADIAQAESQQRLPAVL